MRNWRGEPGKTLGTDGHKRSPPQPLPTVQNTVPADSRVIPGRQIHINRKWNMNLSHILAGTTSPGLRKAWWHLAEVVGGSEAPKAGGASLCRSRLWRKPRSSCDGRATDLPRAQGERKSRCRKRGCFTQICTVASARADPTPLRVRLLNPAISSRQGIPPPSRQTGLKPVAGCLGHMHSMNIDIFKV